MKKIWPVILILGLVLALPSLAWAEDEPATYNFASAQEDSSLTITASDTETYSHIYFYNVDGNRITHITLEVAQAPEGWEVEIDPPLHDQQVSFGGDIITVTENLYAEPTELAFEEIEDVPEGMVCLTLPNRGPTPEEPGFCLAKKVTITISVPESVEVNTSIAVEILATAAWLGQTGAAAVFQTRAFEFTVTLASTSPNRPSNISPANGAVDVATTPTLTSSIFSDAEVYDFHSASQWQVTSTAGDYSSPIFDSLTDTCNLSQVTVPTGILGYVGNDTYYWRVRHQDNHHVWSDWSVETSFTTAPDMRDSDNDGLTNHEESVKYATDPLRADSDGDGLSDGLEVCVCRTDPLKADTDSDGISDGLEAAAAGFDAIVRALPDNCVRVEIIWYGYEVDIETSSSVSGTVLDSDGKRLRIIVSGTEGTTGECAIALPKCLVSPGSKIRVCLDDEPIECELTQDESNFYIEAEYLHSSHELEIDYGFADTTTWAGLPAWEWVMVGVAIGLVGAGVLVASKRRVARR